MTAVELLYKVAERAKALAEERIDMLRIHVGTQDTPAASIFEMRHRRRGEMIEEILTEEFEKDAMDIDGLEELL